MNVRNIPCIVSFAFLIHFNCTTAFAGWVVHLRPSTSSLPESASISYSANVEEGHELINGAIEQLIKEGKLNLLKALHVSWLLDDPVFQAEIFSVLRLNNPTQLEAALQSAGNMHNPKMQAMYEPFANAVLATDTVKKIDKALNSYGLKIEHAPHEKLMLIEADGVKQFDAILWLSVK
jgi:hypothetical protein